MKNNVVERLLQVPFRGVDDLVKFLESYYRSKIGTKFRNEFEVKLAKLEELTKRDCRGYRSDFRTLCERGDCSFRAVLFHRIAHFLRQCVDMVASCEEKTALQRDAALLHEYAQARCGVDINPDATVEGGLFIDESTRDGILDDVIIGQASIIGANVHLERGVIIGAYLGCSQKVSKLCMDRGRRHPKVGRHVHLSRGVRIIGPINIGSWVFVRQNAVINRDVRSFNQI